MAKKWLSPDLVKNVLKNRHDEYAAIQAKLEDMGKTGAVKIVAAERKALLEIANDLFGLDAYDIEIDDRMRRRLAWKSSEAQEGGHEDRRHH